MWQEFTLYTGNSIIQRILINLFDITSVREQTTYTTITVNSGHWNIINIDLNELKSKLQIASRVKYGIRE